MEESMDEILSPEWIREYARIVIKVGLNLQKNQPLIIILHMAAREFGLILLEEAYKMGSGPVRIEYIDADIERIKVQFADQTTLLTADSSVPDTYAERIREGAAILIIVGNDPDFLRDCQSERKTEYFKIYNKETSKVQSARRSLLENSCITIFPTPELSASIFPGFSPATAQQKFSGLMHKIMRLEAPDPVQAWRDHIITLRRRCKQLETYSFYELHFEGPGTDLHVGLVQGHRWQSGAAKSKSGIEFTGNLPTEEVFTAPAAEQVYGHVRSTRPLVLMGTQINRIEFEVEAGKITEENAGEYTSLIRDILDSDTRSRYFGEVALVAESSPLAKANTLFKSILLDENAGCHLAFGTAYPDTVEGGEQMNDEELLEAGINVSSIHIDFIIGSKELQVTGVTADNKRISILRNGNWDGEFI